MSPEYQVMVCKQPQFLGSPRRLFGMKLVVLAGWSGLRRMRRPSRRYIVKLVMAKVNLEQWLNGAVGFEVTYDCGR